MSKLTEDQLALLRRPVLAHVATVMADGRPQSTPVWIDTDGDAILFNTAKGRAKAVNLAMRPDVAISLVNDENAYESHQFRGRAELIEEDGRRPTSTPWPRSTSMPTPTPSASPARNE